MSTTATPPTPSAPPRDAALLAHHGECLVDSGVVSERLMSGSMSNDTVLEPTADEEQGRKVLVVEHVPWEGPGLIADALDRHGVPWRARRLLEDDDPASLPATDELAGLVVMGGPMGALDTDRYPGLALEAELVARCAVAGVPVLGVCLGHQILAVALGGALRRGGHREVGLGPVAVHDRHLGGPDTTTVLHWHTDAVEAPPGARVLASTPTTANQAFGHGSVLALQFHLEVDQALLEHWLTVPEMAADLTADETAALRQDFGRHEPALRARAHRVFGSFARRTRLRRAGHPDRRR